MRYTIAVTSIITTTGSMTVEAMNPEEAQEQVKAALEKAWHHERRDWQAGGDLLDDAHTEHEILCDVMLEDEDA